MSPSCLVACWETSVKDGVKQLLRIIKSFNSTFWISMLDPVIGCLRPILSIVRVTVMSGGELKTWCIRSIFLNISMNLYHKAECPCENICSLCQKIIYLQNLFKETFTKFSAVVSALRLLTRNLQLSLVLIFLITMLLFIFWKLQVFIVEDNSYCPSESIAAYYIVFLLKAVYTKISIMQWNWTVFITK